LLLHGFCCQAQVRGNTNTYHGELRVAGALTSAPHDFQFRLFNAASGGVQIGPTLNLSALSVSLGLFTAPLDFGPGQFSGGRR